MGPGIFGEVKTSLISKILYIIYEEQTNENLQECKSF